MVFFLLPPPFCTPMLLEFLELNLITRSLCQSIVPLKITQPLLLTVSNSVLSARSAHIAFLRTYNAEDTTSTYILSDMDRPGSSYVDTRPGSSYLDTRPGSSIMDRPDSSYMGGSQEPDKTQHESACSQCLMQVVFRRERGLYRLLYPLVCMYIYLWAWTVCSLNTYRSFEQFV